MGKILSPICNISPPTNPEKTTCNKNNYYYDNDSNNDRDAFLMHLNLILSQASAQVPG